MHCLFLYMRLVDLLLDTNEIYDENFCFVSWFAKFPNLMSDLQISGRFTWVRYLSSPFLSQSTLFALICDCVISKLMGIIHGQTDLADFFAGHQIWVKVIFYEFVLFFKLYVMYTSYVFWDLNKLHVLYTWIISIYDLSVRC